MLLNLKYVGKSSNFQKSFILTPFEHSQNAKFIVSVIDSSTSVQPSWLSVDPENQDIIITTDSITSISSFNLSLSARLFTFSQDNFNRITTQSSYISISFTNNNWVMLSSSYPSYLVYNQIEQIQVRFSDDEDDNVIIKLAENPQLSSFVKYSSSTSATIFVQSNSAETSSTTMNIDYTDSYHQDSQYWQHAEIQFSLFASEPPVFVRSLDDVVVSRCQDSVYLLPDYSDPDSFNITAKLDGYVPDWITINNFTISINSKSGQNFTDGLTQIGLILVDETNSWTKYVLNITIEPILSPVFGYINDMSKQQLKSGVLLQVTSTNLINVVDWSNNQVIIWISLRNSMLKVSSNISNYKQTWLRLVSTDSCTNNIYSNSFHIVLSNIPPVLTNTIGPFIAPKGVYTLFEIADDLFIDLNNNPLIYSASITNWSQQHFWDIGVKLSSDSKHYLYVFSNFSMDWVASISASNFYSTSVISTDIKFIKWSSVNCIKCDGPNQNQWTKWKLGYRLDSSGMWLAEANYFLFEGLTFYQICSIVAFVSTIIHIWLSFVLGRNLLNSIINIQLIIVFVFCFNQVDDQLQELLNNILFIKLDFGFIHKLTFDNKFIWCKGGSEKMVELQFYCQSTAQNYFFLLVSSLFVFIWWKVINHFGKLRNFIADRYIKIINAIKIFRKNKPQPKEKRLNRILEWIFINIISLFAAISMINDIFNIADNIISSSLSLVLISVFLVYLYRTKFEILNPKFLIENQSEYQLVCENNLFKL